MLFYPTHILQEDQYLPIRTRRSFKTSLQFTVISPEKLNRFQIVARLPRRQRCSQGWCAIFQQHPLIIRQAKHLKGHWVMAANKTAPFNNQHAILHALNHTLTNQYLIIKRLAPTPCQFFIDHNPLTEQTGQNRGGKKTRRNQTRLNNRCLIKTLVTTP
ncbi:MAG: hypothetical protein IPJ50_03640 [Betaproteobacteria bacterium]|nr:hypothetical protein [Betaproteobacteria bacterium]